MRRIVGLLLACCGALACGSGDGARVAELEQRVAELEDDNQRLRRQLGIDDPADDSSADLDDADLLALSMLPQETVGEAPTAGRDPLDTDTWDRDGAAAAGDDTAPPVPVTAETGRELAGAADTDPPRASGTAPPAAAPPAADRDRDEPPPAPAAGPTPVLPPAESSPPPDPAGEAATADAGDDGPSMIIHRAVLGTAVVGREPRGVADRFAADVGKVYCFTEVSLGPGRRASTLVHRWSHEGTPQGETALKIGGDGWRTFSNRTITDTKLGRWRVELIDDDGSLLQALDFVVE